MLLLGLRAAQFSATPANFFFYLIIRASNAFQRLTYILPYFTATARRGAALRTRINTTIVVAAAAAAAAAVAAIALLCFSHSWHSNISSSMARCRQPFFPFISMIRGYHLSS